MLNADQRARLVLLAEDSGQAAEDRNAALRELAADDAERADQVPPELDAQ